jgi:tripartite-type tricarboxylate transporter receptor subunit TctC
MRALFGFCAIAMLAATTSAQAQNPYAYPDRPIRLLVAFVPGGATDTLARQISNDLKEALGQSIVVENRPGAGGYIAWNHVATSDPDGYTLLLAENALAISQALYKKSKSNFEPVTPYDAVTGIAVSPSALIVANTLPAKSVAELSRTRQVPRSSTRLGRNRQRIAPQFQVSGTVPHGGGSCSLRAAAGDQDVVVHVPMTSPRCR